MLIHLLLFLLSWFLLAIVTATAISIRALRKAPSLDARSAWEAEMEVYEAQHSPHSVLAELANLATD